MDDRTQILAHYIIFRSTPEKLGAVKLNKVMWFSDLEAFRRSGRSISGQASYEKRQFGPVPNNIIRHLKSLRESGKIVERLGMTPVGDRREFIWLDAPDVSRFSADEIDIINRAIDWVCDTHTAVTISNETHDPLWDETNIGDQIAIEAAIVTTKPVRGRYLQWARDQADGSAEVR